MNTLVANAFNAPIATHSLESYILSANKIDMLTQEQEINLANQWLDNQDQKAAYQLVLAHLKFVIKIAKEYNGYGLVLADLIQEGNIGLMKAVKKFDPLHKVRLASYAVYWIKSEIHEYIIKNWRIVKIATTKAQRKLFFKLRGAKKSLHWLTDKETQALAETLQVKKETVNQMEGRLYNQDVLFDPTPDDNETHRSPEEYLSDSVNPIDSLVKNEKQQYAENALKKQLKTLDKRSRDIVQKRWLNEEKSTLKTLAKEYNVSFERIRQIEAEALLMLRSKIVKIS